MRIQSTLITFLFIFLYQLAPASDSGPVSPVSVNPLITVSWNQGCYYNEKCPADVSATNSCYHTLAGSGAVAMAQIMKYFNYPPHGFGSFEYTLPGYGNLYVNFGTTTYDWNGMPDSLSSSNDAVSTLIYHCGVAQQMNYNPVQSTSLSSLIDDAFRNFFGYNSNALWKWKADYPSDQWIAMLKAELDAGRPLLYYGNNGGADEKFFICDGYNDSNSFHFNWGGGGVDNGYYLLNALTPGTHDYSSAQGAIFNLAPSTSSNQSMDFESISDFSLTFSPWTINDVDGDSTSLIPGHTFPNNGAPMAFIDFNPAMVNPSITDTALQPHSGNRFGACFASVGHPNNDWFISPRIQLGTDGQFSFWERSYSGQANLERFNVLVSTTDNSPSSFVLISGSTPLTAPLKWIRKFFSLSAYNNQNIFVAIQCVSSGGSIFMIDDLDIKTSSTSSLSADFIADRTTIRAGEKVNFTDESAGNPTTWSWSFSGGFPTVAGTENPANIRYDYPGIYTVSLKISDGTSTDSITKTGYINVTGYPSYMALDFESVSDFTLNFDSWSVYDVNGGPTWQIKSVTFPNEGMPMAFICFNPSMALPPPINMTAHSGKKYGACFSSMPPYAPNNKWLISPRMTMGTNASISFWVQTYDTSYGGLETYNVGVSASGTNPSDFVLLNTTPLDAPAAWTKENFLLTNYSGQDVYVGINCVSDNKFIFMIDDIEIGSSLDVESNIPKNSITVYPNPARDYVLIDFGKPGMYISTLALLNQTGKIMKEFSLNRKQNESFYFPLNGLSTGVYILMMNSDTERIVKKIVILD